MVSLRDHLLAQLATNKTTDAAYEALGEAMVNYIVDRTDDRQVAAAVGVEGTASLLLWVARLYFEAKANGVEPPPPFELHDKDEFALF
jgi:hypothetical protein